MSQIITSGVDVGASAVKVAVARVGDGKEEIIGLATERLRRRDPRGVIEQVYGLALRKAGVAEKDVQYVASTGEGELVKNRTGHFYGMTTHARGALFLEPQATAALDVGALHARAIKMDERARVLGYRMTSQCASGSGQFLENISRYLGVTLDEVGELSMTATKPEKVSGICAVLAETDVINMVSRGISTADILKGIHDSMAGRFVKLLRASKCTGTVAVTGGLAADIGLVAAMDEAVTQSKLNLTLVADPRSVYAGAIGAALWGAFRWEKMRARRLASSAAEVRATA